MKENSEKNSTPKKDRYVAQIAERANGDVFFKGLRALQEEVLEHMTDGIENQELKALKKELLKKEPSYSLNGLARKVGEFVFKKGIEVEDLFTI